MIGLDFGRGFGPALRFTARYRRINNAGYFQNLKSFDDALAFGLHYLPPGGRYRGIAYFMHNENRQQDNGGIVSEAEDVFGNTVVAPPGQLEVRLSEAFTRLAKNRYVYSQYLSLSTNAQGALSTNAQGALSTNAQGALSAGAQGTLSTREGRADVQADSTSGLLFQPGWYLHAKTALEAFEYKFYDKLAADDTLTFEPLDNARGMRVFLHNLSLDQQLDLQWMKAAADSNGAEGYALAGLYYQRNRLRFEPEDTLLGMMYFLTEGRFAKARWVLEWNAARALSGESGAYRADLLLQYWIFRLRLETVSRRPVYLARRMYITQQEVWSQDLANEQYQRAGLGLSLGRGLLNADFRFTRLQQAVYFDTTLHPQQLDEEVLLAEAIVKTRLRVWRLHYDQQTRLSLSDSEVLPVPLLYSEQQLYFKGPLFKGSLEFLFGTELNLLSPYRLPAYHPLIGSFFYAHAAARDWQPFLHLFLAGRMKNIRFYFRLENVLPPFTGRYYYLAEGYPQPQLGFRFGLSASFRN